MLYNCQEKAIMRKLFSSEQKNRNPGLGGDLTFPLGKLIS